MIYDIYEQNEQTQDVIEHRLVTRYHTIHKKKAFLFMNKKNKLAGKNIWRVAVQVTNYIFFDIDSLEVTNLTLIKRRYSQIFHYNFRVIETKHGYHLISEKRYTDGLEWQYDICKVLYPLLEKPNLQTYIEAIEKYYKEYKDVPDFLDIFPEKFKESGLFCGIGNFDILFAINVILKGYYCLRISKKSRDDNPKEITI